MKISQILIALALSVSGAAFAADKHAGTATKSSQYVVVPSLKPRTSTTNW